MAQLGDKTWNLWIFITDLKVEISLRVTGDEPINSLVYQFLDPENIKDWSDYGYWWSEENMWILNTKLSLSQMAVMPNSRLFFTRKHKILRVQLPDLRVLNCRLDFSDRTSGTVASLCKELGIRHPEELSFCKPINHEHLKKNYAKFPFQKFTLHDPSNSDTNSVIIINTKSSVKNDDDKTKDTENFEKNGVSLETSNCSGTDYSSFDSLSSQIEFHKLLATTPEPPSMEVRARMLGPYSFVERARMNIAWLQSTLSLMEQYVREYDTLCLKFKYSTFFDLDPKCDQVRISQLYEQAKWSVLNDEIDMREFESINFSAIQFHINYLTYMKPQEPEVQPEETLEKKGTADETSSTKQTRKLPEISDYLKFLKPQKFVTGVLKTFFFIHRDMYLYIYERAEESKSGAPILTISLRNCEITSKLNIMQGRYALRLVEYPEEEHVRPSVVWICFDNEVQYTKWMTVCRLASKGSSLVDEISSINSPPYPDPLEIDPSSVDMYDYMSPRFVTKLRPWRAMQRMLHVHVHFMKLNVIEAKLNYIQKWQTLKNFGVTLFVVELEDHDKEDLLAITKNRIMHMDIETGEIYKAWRNKTMRMRKVNSELNSMYIEFIDEDLLFSCSSCDCKTIYEFIGGYMYMSMRSKKNNQIPNEQTFIDLTSTWD